MTSWGFPASPGARTSRRRRWRPGPTGTRPCGARVRGLRGLEGPLRSLSVWAALRQGEGAPTVRARDPRARDMEFPVVVSREGRAPARRGSSAPTALRGLVSPHVVGPPATQFDLGGQNRPLPDHRLLRRPPGGVRTSTRLDDELSAGSTEDALGGLRAAPSIIDGGGKLPPADGVAFRRQRPTVSMSRSASPDNARAEGCAVTPTAGVLLRGLEGGLRLLRVAPGRAGPSCGIDEKIKRSLGWKTIAGP